MDRRRMMMAAQTPPTPSIQPYFRLAFTNGLTPEIAPVGTTVTAVGTVTTYYGHSDTENGALHISPNPFIVGPKTYRFKYKQSAVRLYAGLYTDWIGFGSGTYGYIINVGSDNATAAKTGGGVWYIRRVVRWVNNGAGNYLLQLPTQTADQVYDLVFTTTGDTTTDGCKLYVDGVLVDTFTLPMNESQVNGSYAQLMEQGTGGNGFAGSVYLMELYDRVLTADEVLELYNS